MSGFETLDKNNWTQGTFAITFYQKKSRLETYDFCLAYRVNSRTTLYIEATPQLLRGSYSLYDPEESLVTNDPPYSFKYPIEDPLIYGRSIENWSYIFSIDQECLNSSLIHSLKYLIQQEMTRRRLKK